MADLTKGSLMGLLVGAGCVIIGVPFGGAALTGAVACGVGSVYAYNTANERKKKAEYHLQLLKITHPEIEWANETQAIEFMKKLPSDQRSATLELWIASKL